MPWYDFQCRSCDHEFTEILAMDDRDKPTRKKCSECGKKTVSKLFGNVQFGDPMNLGLQKPSSAYTEVVEKIRENTGIKGTKYDIDDRIRR